MYWRAETAEAWHAFWGDVRSVASGLDLPNLTAPQELPLDWHDHWLRPDLSLSMTCGLPFRSRLKEKVTYITTPDFGLNPTPGHYHSVIVMQPDRAPNGALRLAFNAPDSQSGWAAACEFRDATPGLTFRALVQTGAHAESMAAVAEGDADLAALDAVTWRLLKQYDPFAKHVVEVARTRALPGLPLVAAAGLDPAPLRAALHDAFERQSQHRLAQLGGLCGFATLNPADYYALPLPPVPATD